MKAPSWGALLIGEGLHLPQLLAVPWLGLGAFLLLFLPGLLCTPPLPLEGADLSLQLEELCAGLLSLLHLLQPCLQRLSLLDHLAERLLGLPSGLS